MRKPVRRLSRHRQESPCQFVLTLCPSLKYLDLACYTKLDGLVVAGLEMQTGVIFQCAPRATIQRGFGREIQRTRYGSPFKRRYDQSSLPLHRGA